MSTVLILACLWVIAAAVVAMLPMRHQYLPGIALLIAAPVLIWALGQTHGLWAAGLGLFALLSMFRNPLRYYLGKAMGQTQETPK
ncbi:MAG: DUF2484 family protein [Roseovarius sp.]